ncbi:MAG TPA: antibiotic biosynthesis monooxygenase [Candidatus Sulfotelmatobacter sp.]|nr:antibiotic biosynthesis monooxygenase [Candidatus Sulfotelmatobacter sp.]
MFVILWEFEVKPGSEDRFQNAYGPVGPWVQLFQSDRHYRGTLLQRDPARPLFYFTIDLWDTEAAYQAFLDANRVAYGQLDGDTEHLASQQRHILSFTL